MQAPPAPSFKSYTYNAWGEILSATGDMADINPLRYRGYYFDSDTGLYYLKARYYNPEIGRWINADDTANLGVDVSILSYNLFTYCLNNPVNRFDVDGNWSMPNWLKVTVGAVAIAGGASGAVVVSPRQSTNYIVNKISNMLSSNLGTVGKIVTWVRNIFK